jgi:hypothetical protein
VERAGVREYVWKWVVWRGVEEWRVEGRWLEEEVREGGSDGWGVEGHGFGWREER